jgi:vacuolar-type H+-ATPase subunit E/Vma4
VGDEPAVVRCPLALVPAVRSAVKRMKHVTVEGDAAAPPGIRVITSDGAIEVDNTLEGRLERLRVRLALEVLAALEPSR